MQFANSGLDLQADLNFVNKLVIMQVFNSLTTVLSLGLFQKPIANATLGREYFTAIESLQLMMGEAVRTTTQKPVIRKISWATEGGWKIAYICIRAKQWASQSHQRRILTFRVFIWFSGKWKLPEIWGNIKPENFPVLQTYFEVVPKFMGKILG